MKRRPTKEHHKARSLPLAHRRISEETGRRHSWCSGFFSNDQSWYFTSTSPRSSSAGSSPRKRRQRARRIQLECYKSAQRSPDKEACAFSCRHSVDKSDVTLDTEDLFEESHLKLVKFNCLDSPCPENDERRETGLHSPPDDRGPEKTRRSSLKTALSRSIPCCEQDKRLTVVFVDEQEDPSKPGKKVTIRVVDSPVPTGSNTPPSPAPRSPEPRIQDSCDLETAKYRGIVCRKFLVKETHITNSDEDLETEKTSSNEASLLRDKYLRSEPYLSYDWRRSEPSTSYDYSRWEPYKPCENPPSGLPWYDTYISEPTTWNEPHRSDNCYENQPNYKYYRSDPPSSYDYYRSDIPQVCDDHKSDHPRSYDYYRSDSWNESYDPTAKEANLKSGPLVSSESTKTGSFINNESRWTNPVQSTDYQIVPSGNELSKEGLPVCTEPRRAVFERNQSGSNQSESYEPSTKPLTGSILRKTGQKTETEICRQIATAGTEAQRTGSHISNLPHRIEQPVGPELHKTGHPAVHEPRKILPPAAKEIRRRLPNIPNEPRKLGPLTSKTGPFADNVTRKSLPTTVNDTRKILPASKQSYKTVQPECKTGPSEDNETCKTVKPPTRQPLKAGPSIVEQPRKTGPPPSRGPQKILPQTGSQPKKSPGPSSSSEPRPSGLRKSNDIPKVHKKEPPDPGGPKPALNNQRRRSSDLENFKADNKLYSPTSPDVDPNTTGRYKTNSLLGSEENERRQFTENQRRPMRKMNPLEDHERKIIIEFCHLLEKSKQLFNGLRELPQYGHKQWHSYFGRTFDVYTKLWKFQQQHRAILDSKYGLKRWQIGEIASKIGQLYYHFYLRTSDTAYLNEAFSFYSAIRGRCYYTKASKEDKCELMVKKLRYYARFIVVCLLLKKIKLVRELTKELDRQIIEYGNTYDPDDQMEWIVVVDEVKAFIQAEPVITVLHPDNYPVVISYRLNTITLTPVERSSQIALSLQEVVIVGSCNQVKFSELTMDMYRMLHTLEREPSESAQQMYDDSPRPRFISTPCAPTSKGYPDGRRKDNPHKYLLFKPSPAQILVYLASGCHDLPPNGALLLYISADGHILPQSKQPDEAAYEMGGLITTSKNDIYRENRSQDSKAGPSTPKGKEPHCLYPGDLTPFTRRPLFIIIDSDNSHIFQNIPRHFGVPLLILMSPVELPDRLQDRKQHGNLFTLFLHSPLSAFCCITDVVNLPLSLWEKAMDNVDSFLMEATSLLARSRVDSAILAFMSDDFLRLLLLRFIFCEVTTRRHRSFRTRNHFARSSPVLPEELYENPTLTQIVMDLASLLQVRGLFQDPTAGPPNTKE